MVCWRLNLNYQTFINICTVIAAAISVSPVWKAKYSCPVDSKQQPMEALHGNSWYDIHNFTATCFLCPRKASCAGSVYKTGNIVYLSSELFIRLLHYKNHKNRESNLLVYNNNDFKIKTALFSNCVIQRKPKHTIRWRLTQNHHRVSNVEIYKQSKIN